MLVYTCIATHYAGKKTCTHFQVSIILKQFIAS